MGVKVRGVEINPVAFQMDCSICLHEAAHLVLTYVLTGGTPHGATVVKSKEYAGCVFDPGLTAGLRLRSQAEDVSIILLAGNYAERRAFSHLCQTFAGGDGAKVRRNLADHEPDPKKRRAWSRELHARTLAEVERWWPLIVMTAIILQVKRTLDRPAIYRICGIIDRITGENPYERVQRRRGA